MKSWKEHLNQPVLDINSIMSQYDQMLFIARKTNEDLEKKNKTLHNCAYTTHSRLDQLVTTIQTNLAATVTDPAITNLVNQIVSMITDVKTTMEGILESGNSPKQIVEHALVDARGFQAREESIPAESRLAPDEAGT